MTAGDAAVRQRGLNQNGRSPCGERTKVDFDAWQPREMNWLLEGVVVQRDNSKDVEFSIEAKLAEGLQGICGIVFRILRSVRLRSVFLRRVLQAAAGFFPVNPFVERLTSRAQRDDEEDRNEYGCTKHLLNSSVIFNLHPSAGMLMQIVCGKQLDFVGDFLRPVCLCGCCESEQGGRGSRCLLEFGFRDGNLATAARAEVLFREARSSVARSGIFDSNMAEETPFEPLALRLETVVHCYGFFQSG